MCTSAGRLDATALVDLDPWSIDGRYADDLLDATKVEARRLAELARTVVESATTAVG